MNKDPRKLDDMYTRLLGSEGPSLLSDETKWLAITHKSFDHGRRGFNDRLAYFGLSHRSNFPNRMLTTTGRRIVELQASLGMLSMSGHFKTKSQEASIEHPEHPDLEGLEALTEEMKTAYVNPKRIADLARNTGLPDVMRWVPRDVGVPAVCDFIQLTTTAREPGLLRTQRRIRPGYLRYRGCSGS